MSRTLKNNLHLIKMKEECDRLKKPAIPLDIKDLSEKLENKIDMMDTKLALRIEIQYSALRKDMFMLLIFFIFLSPLLYHGLQLILP